MPPAIKAIHGQTIHHERCINVQRYAPLRLLHPWKNKKCSFIHECFYSRYQGFTPRIKIPTARLAEDNWHHRSSHNTNNLKIGRAIEFAAL